MINNDVDVLDQRIPRNIAYYSAYTHGFIICRHFPAGLDVDVDADNHSQIFNGTAVQFADYTAYRIALKPGLRSDDIYGFSVAVKGSSEISAGKSRDISVLGKVISAASVMSVSRIFIDERIEKLRTVQPRSRRSASRIITVFVFFQVSRFESGKIVFIRKRGSKYSVPARVWSFPALVVPNGTDRKIYENHRAVADGAGIRRCSRIRADFPGSDGRRQGGVPAGICQHQRIGVIGRIGIKQYLSSRSFRSRGRLNA